MGNTTLIKKLVFEFGEPVVKILGLPIVGAQPTLDKCKEWIKSQSTNSVYYWYYDGYKYSIFEIIPVSDTQITNLVLTLQSERISKIHSWVKFWSIATLIGVAVAIILIAAI